MSIRVRLTKKAVAKMAAEFATNKERYGRELKYIELDFGPGGYRQQSRVTVQPDGGTVVIHLGPDNADYRRKASLSLVTCDLKSLFDKAQAGLLERMTQLEALGSALRDFVTGKEQGVAIENENADDDEDDPNLDTENEDENSDED